MAAVLGLRPSRPRRRLRRALRPRLPRGDGAARGLRRDGRRRRRSHAARRRRPRGHGRSGRGPIPSLVIHGTEDATVAPVNAEQVLAQSMAANAPRRRPAPARTTPPGPPRRAPAAPAAATPTPTPAGWTATARPCTSRSPCTGWGTRGPAARPAAPTPTPAGPTPRRRSGASSPRSAWGSIPGDVAVGVHRAPSPPPRFARRCSNELHHRHCHLACARSTRRRPNGPSGPGWRVRPTGTGDQKEPVRR